ncbi:MAG: hypothetical protein K8F91_10990 [Candidatus Obscuribacterales bacterium]|nr:hypothetical protein [Candidatus Obscuribacterales bacterium]
MYNNGQDRNCSSDYRYGYSNSNSAKNDNCYSNQAGDSITRDQEQRITSFKYRQHDSFYSFEYEKDGSVRSIDRSDGWNWRKVKSEDFTGWVVKNYWDSWSVKEEDSGSVLVDDSGLHATGQNAEQLAFPEL